MKNYRYFAIFLFLLVWFSKIFAIENPNDQMKFLFTADGGSEGTSQLDIALPFLANSEDYLFSGLSGKAGLDKAYVASIGLGGRHLTKKNNILGGLLYLENLTTSEGKDYWLLNPGFELFHNDWDIHINGNLPISKSNHTLLSGRSDLLGIERGIRLNGHTISALGVKFYDEIGINANLNIGYTSKKLKNTRISLGEYYSHFDHAENIHGLQFDVMLPINPQLTLHVADSYDNVFHNNVVIGFSLYFDQSKQPLEFNQLDSLPIRYQGTLNTGASVPSQTTMQFTKESTTIMTNAWFFSPTSMISFNSTLGEKNCTAENPCAGSNFTQANIDAINAIIPNTNLLLASGTYLINSEASSNQVTLNKGQSIYGRNSNFTMPASSTQRPVLHGSLGAAGNNVFSDFNLTGSGTSEYTGFFAQNTDHIKLQNIHISDYYTETSAEPKGISLNTVNNVEFENVHVSHINGRDGLGSTAGSASGIRVDTSDAVTFHRILVDHIYGGQGSNGADGANGADVGGAAGGIAGNGSAGTDATNGGPAVGISVVDSTNIIFSELDIHTIQAGSGGDGGKGGSGGDASTSMASNAAAVAGSGANSGASGDGSQATGIYLSSSTASFNTFNVSKISGGHGGDSGAGGYGGDASLANYRKISNGNSTDAAGTAGAGGSSTAGGNGGNAKGIDIADSNIVLNSGQITMVAGGQAGRGGQGGQGGAASASNNSENSSGGVVLNGGISGFGGIGGRGGAGGAAVGIIADEGQLKVNNVLINQTLGGNGGNGAQGGSAGDSQAKDNTELGNGSLTLNGGTAAQGGNGGNGGTGGRADGIILNNSVTAAMSNSSVRQAKAGVGGTGGAGGAGGDASTNNNSETDGGTLRPYGGTGGNGGIGGNSGDGGDAHGISVDNSSLSLKNFGLEQIIAGQSLKAGVGGNGGAADSNQNIELNGGQLAARSGAGGAAGNGGVGGSGGTAKAVDISNGADLNMLYSSIIMVNGGFGGAGGHGGQGGSGNSNENIDRGSGTLTINNNNNLSRTGAGGKGGDSGIGGAAFGISVDSSNATVSGINFKNLKGANSGSAGQGGDAGSGNANVNSESGDGSLTVYAGRNVANGGIGGDSANSGGVTGIYAESASSITMTNNIFDNLFAGSASHAGDGGHGGAANSNSNTGADDGNTTARGGFAGDGGNGGNAGDGAFANSLLMTGGSSYINSGNIMKNIFNGSGGSGGNGGNGGDAFASSVVSNSIPGTPGAFGYGGAGGAQNGTAGSNGHSGSR